MFDLEKPLPKGPTKIGLSIIKPKYCGKCKRAHKFIPIDTPFKSGLFWWDCKCGSTLCADKDFIASDKIKEKVQLLENTENYISDLKIKGFKPSKEFLFIFNNYWRKLFKEV